MRVALVMLALALAACGPPDDNGADASTNGCGDVLPSSCGPAAPSYRTEVAPIVQAKCVTCHTPGGLAATEPLGSYDALFQRRETALFELHACLMPEAGGAPLTKDERHTLELWLVCGAPEN